MVKINLLTGGRYGGGLGSVGGGGASFGEAVLVEAEKELDTPKRHLTLRQINPPLLKKK